MDRNSYLMGFQNAASQIDARILAEKQLKVWYGTHLECHVLKIYKESWATPFEDPIASPSRIFFSVWIDPAKEHKLFYNIHALKLRHLKGYRIESRKFAEIFRKEFKGFAHNWENVSVESGPLTLMQGFSNIGSDNFQSTVLKLSNQFLEIEHLIDQTLTAFKMA